MTRRCSPTRRARWLLFACALAAWLSPTDALASRSYSEIIRDSLELHELPSCTFCHVRNDAGTSVGTSFSAALQSRGFDRRSTGSLSAALVLLEADGFDSDGDGVPDVAELRSGGDPSLPPPAGCSVRVDTEHRPGDAGLVSSFGFVVVLRRLARSRARRRAATDPRDP